VSAEVADRISSCESDANIHTVPPLEVFTDPRKICWPSHILQYSVNTWYGLTVGWVKGTAYGL